MFNRTTIMQAAWAIYRKNIKWMRAEGEGFKRGTFRNALREAWMNAKAAVAFAMVEATQAAEPAPIRAARNEMLDLAMKDHWTPADYARQSALSAFVAAA